MKTKCEWESRELSRFVDGTYKPVPVALDYPAKHYVHLSVTDTENDYVAYTPSDAYGEADRQVRLKFGRYLHKTFPNMTDADVQSHVTALKSALSIVSRSATLHFARDIETINQIFETRMCAWGSTYDSCMYGKFGEQDIRPYHVYANSPDVAVAYITVDNKIVSRSVVSTKDKTWVRCYSVAGGDNDTDCGTLRTLLEDAGYTAGELVGNRLTKLKTRGVMLPYIDNGGLSVLGVGYYWEVVSDGDGDYECNQTDGTASEVGNWCECCGNREDDCQCCTCECCGELSTNGCDECRMCECCNSCITHDNCDCERCSDCGEIINPRRRYITRCECDRCGECGQLTDDCKCEDETEDETPTEAPEAELPLTPEQIRMKLNRIYAYLRDTYGLTTESPEYKLLKSIFDTIKTEEVVTA